MAKNRPSPGAFTTVPLVALVSMFKLMPWRIRLAFGSWLMDAAVRLVPKYRQRVETNLRIIMPEMTARERRSVRRSMSDNFGRTIVETLDSRRFHDLADWVPPEGDAADVLLAAARGGRGAVLVTGHFGQWEALRGWLRAEGVTCGGVYRPVRNPWLNNVYEKSIRLGGPIFPKDRTGVRAMVRHLAQHGVLAIGADQHERRGAAIDFIGRPAPTTLVPAEMALKFKIPLIPFYGLREPNGRTIRVFVEPEIPADDPNAMMRAVNDSLGAMVRANPGQYYWLHRRWEKNLPDPERPGRTI